MDAHRRHDYRLLDILARQPNTSQRVVARQAGLSLGMVNLVLRRLAKTGFIRVSALNGQTMRYVLTPEGSAELTRRSYEYVLRVISSFGALRDGITGLVRERFERGDRHFLIYGHGDVADIADLACRTSGIDGLSVARQRDGAVHGGAGIAILDCRIESAEADNRVGIHVLTYLAQGARGGD
jgi:DNA-binding MarR family transcriptional regulator